MSGQFHAAASLSQWECPVVVPHSWPGWFGEDMNLVSLKRIKPQFLRCPDSGSIVTILTTLSRLHFVLCKKWKDVLKIFTLLEIITYAVCNGTQKLAFVN